MKLFSYIVTDDTGFSPNPFHGYCTLACCKPAIRRTAKEKDWIVGLTPKSEGNRIVYLMQVDEIESFDEYWNDRRFQQKKPCPKGDRVMQRGDNIYEPNSHGGFRQLASLHSDQKCRAREDSGNKKRDLSGECVLISENFAYFGRKTIDLPPGLKTLIVARSHRCRFPVEAIFQFQSFTEKIRFGVHAAPKIWDSNDDSWKRAAGSWLVAE